MKHHGLRIGGALVITLVCAAAIIAGCNDHQLTGPHGAPIPPVSFSQGSPDVPVQGCATWKITLTGGSGVTATSVSKPSCGPILPVPQATATYDATAKIITLTVADSNAWTRQVVAPTRIYAWNDSLIITTPSGLKNGMSGAYLQLTGMDSTIGSSAATFKNARLWRYDTLLAAHGQTQVLPPRLASRSRTIQIKVVSGSPSVFTILLRVQAQNPFPVPLIPPVGTPIGTYDDTNIVVDAARFGTMRVVKNAVHIGFTSKATQAQRQAAVDSVSGIVVGGSKLFSNGDGFYLVRLPTSTAAALIPALIKLRSLPQVSLAEPVALLHSGLQGRVGHDGPGWDSSKYTFRVSDRSGSTWALKAIRAPLAWGCDTGSTTASKLAIVDVWFFTSTDLAPSIAVGLDSGNSAMLRAHPHGQHVASIAAALGNNGKLMTGVAWRSQLSLYDYRVLANINGTSDDPDEMIPDAIGRAGRDGAQIINVSSGITWLGTEGHLPVANSADTNMVRLFVKNLVYTLARLDSEVPSKRPLIVISAGNDRIDAKWNGFVGVKDPRWGAPASIKARILVVGGTQRAADAFWATDVDIPGQGSNWGSTIDVVAPAEHVPGLNGNDVVDSTGSGTSFSAPLAAGVAALLASFDPRLTADSIAILIKAGAVAGGRSVSDGHGGLFYILDAYEALRAAGGRVGAPLCGNRTWGIDNYIATNRTGDLWEYLNVSSYTGPLEHVQVAHGGHWLEFNDARGGNARYRATWSQLGWTIGAGTCFNCAELSGAARSGDAIRFGGPVHSHNGDTTLEYNSGLPIPIKDLPYQEGLYLRTPNSNPLLLYIAETLIDKSQGTFANAPGALAYSPTGDFAIYSTYDYPTAAGWFDTHIFRISIPGKVVTHLFDLPQQDAPWLAISEDGNELALGSTWIGGCSIEYWSLKTNLRIPGSYDVGQDTAGTATNNAGYPTCFLGGSSAADVVGVTLGTGARGVSASLRGNPSPPPAPRGMIKLRH